MMAKAVTQTTPATASLSNFSGTLTLIGAGKMGSAMLDGWLALGLDPAKVAVIEPEPSAEVARLVARGLALNPPSGVANATSVVVIAIKPQIASEVLPDLTPLVDASTLVISIMAGRTLDFLARALPGNAAIVRAMPNTPAAIGRGISVAVANARATPLQRDLAQGLLSAVGMVEWIDDEALMDAVTAVSGSGPAYVFLLAESLARAGAAAGLPADLSARLARATVAGSGELLHRVALDAATLRRNVTSPGGTTAAALDVLMGNGGLDQLMTEAVAAATRRSRALAG
jgi:pyrroline-5-carboxylate reductase